MPLTPSAAVGNEEKLHRQERIFMQRQDTVGGIFGGTAQSFFATNGGHRTLGKEHREFDKEAGSATYTCQKTHKGTGRFSDQQINTRTFVSIHYSINILVDM